jgi:hypothetical protein
MWELTGKKIRVSGRRRHQRRVGLEGRLGAAVDRRRRRLEQGGAVPGAGGGRQAVLAGGGGGGSMANTLEVGDMSRC